MGEVRRFSGLAAGSGPAARLGEFELEAGTKVVVFGPNGAGKSTLLRAIAGTAMGRLRPDVTYLPQRAYLFRGTARRNLLLGLDEVAARRAVELAGRFGAGHLLDRRANHLSGGERQRLALARTLAADAPVVLLDEPLAPLDLRDREAVAAEVVNAIGGRSAVIVSHDPNSVAELGDEVAVMVDGEIRQRGPVAQVFAMPADDVVAGVVGLGNVLRGVVVERAEPLVRVASGGIDIWALGDQAVDTAVRVLFGAEAVTVYGADPVTGSARNVWKGTVEQLRPVGRLVEVVVDAGARVVALLTPGSLEALGIDTGSPVTVAVKATAVTAVTSAP